MDIEIMLRWSISATAVVLLIVIGALMLTGKTDINARLGCRATLSQLNGFARRFAELYIDVACGVVLLSFAAVAAVELLALNLAGASLAVFSAVFFPTIALSVAVCIVVSRLRFKSLLCNVQDQL